jgi:hypothetical protein
MNRIEPTKPAGCAMQLMAIPLLLVGIISATSGAFVSATIASALGVWLLVAGRRPAVRGQEDQR